MTAARGKGMARLVLVGVAAAALGLADGAAAQSAAQSASTTTDVRPGAGASMAANVTGVRVGDHRGFTRVVLDVSGPTDVRYSQSADGTMVVADLPGAAWRAPDRQALRSRLVSGYETQPLPGGGTRVTVAASTAVGLMNTMALTPHGGRGNRIVIDLSPDVAPMPPAPDAVQTQTVAAAQPAPRMAQADGMGGAGMGMAHPAHIAPQISTLGLGAEAGYRVDPHLGLRAGANLLTMNRSFDVDGIDYDADARLLSFGLLGDVYPFPDLGLHLTGGVRLNLNRADVSATPTTAVTIGDTTYSPDQIGTLDGSVEFNRLAPYLGVGWKGSFGDPNLIVGADLGVMFQGTPKVSLSSTGLLTSPQLSADLERERAKIEDELEAFRFYPVVGLSVGYRF